MQHPNPACSLRHVPCSPRKSSPSFGQGQWLPQRAQVAALTPHPPCSAAPTCACSSIWHWHLHASALRYEQAGLGKPVASGLGGEGVVHLSPVPSQAPAMRGDWPELLFQACSDAEAPGWVSSQPAPTSPACSHLCRSHKCCSLPSPEQLRGSSLCQAAREGERQHG